MQQPKQMIQLSEHVKNKIKSHQITPFSFSSDELILSDTDDNDNDSLVSSYPQQSVRRRSATFITYQIQQPSKSEPFFTDTRINPNQRQLCQECLRRENLLQNEHQRLLRIQKENRQLSEQLHLSVLLNDQYQEEIVRLKQHLTKLSIHLQEYQMNFQLLQEKPTKSKPDIEIDQLKRLRHELHVYNQVIANKRNEEQKQINYFSQK